MICTVLYSFFLVLIALLLGIPSAYVLSERKRKDIFAFLDIVNVYVLLGISLLVISMDISFIMEAITVSLFVYLRSLSFFLKILFSYDVRHKVMFLSLGYTKKEYFLKYLIPRSVKSIISYFLETFGILFIALAIGRSELISTEVVNVIQIFSILIGLGIFFLEKLRVSKHYGY